MAAWERSLRRVVESWLGTLQAGHIRVTRFSHTRKKMWRYVCVEATYEKDTLAIVFFRHDDGSWGVFPPAPRSPVMGAAMDNHALLRRPSTVACEP
ncbi:hypothetical protein [Paraburkholderia heleia]|uniref:hypothetical protein n=1 Tax=Paraburkholderia heleia TaxID=634127 RepID=UPI0031E0C651